MTMSTLDELLSDIYREYIAIRDEDFALHYTILKEIVLEQLHTSMKQVDRYYDRYHGAMDFGGSHFDKLRIEKPDEFDINMIVGLPISMDKNINNPENSDINIKHGKRGSSYIEFKMGTQFLNLPRRADYDINKTAYNWLDSKKFLSRERFYSWFKKVVDKALNQYRHRRKSPPVFNVDGTNYTVQRKQCGPAVTLTIESFDKEVKLSVDLVPALRFPESRWPPGKDYRKIPPGCEKDYWLAIPKPDKQWQGGVRWSSRSWRMSLHYQEKQLLHDMYNLRQTIRLIKKVRNACGMHEIKSYFIKTLFLWKAHATNASFWKKSPGTLFIIMVYELQKCVIKRKIPYFWNKRCNLLDNTETEELKKAEAELNDLLEVLEDPDRWHEVPTFFGLEDLYGDSDSDEDYDSDSEEDYDSYIQDYNWLY